MLDLLEGLAAKVTDLYHLVLSLGDEILNSVDVCSFEAVEASYGQVELLDGHFEDLITLRLGLFDDGRSVADCVGQVGEQGEVVAENLCTERHRITCGDSLVRPHLDGQLVKVGLIAHAGILDRVVDLQDGCVDRINGDGPDCGLGRFILVRRYIAPAVIEGKLHGERTVRSKGGYGLLRIEDLDLGVCLDVAGGDNAFADGLNVDGLGLGGVETGDDALNVKNDLGHIFLNTGDGRKLMLHALDPDTSGRNAWQRIEQHAPQRIAQRLPKAALQRVDHKLAIPIVLADFNALDFWLFDLIDHLAFPPSRRRAFQAQAVNVTVAYQTSAEPAKVAQADNTFAKESGATVDWRKFDSGASIVRALASGDVQIGNLGSSPLAVATSQQVPIEVFLLASKLGNSEALVVKKTISKPEDLIGKRIAVPFISTTHYSLLAALKHWGIKPGQVEIVNLQPPAIIAAWQRGDIDGAYVWAPAVNALEKDGKVLTDSEQVGQWGAPTLDVWVVRKDFAEKHPEVVKAFAKSAIDAQQPYIANPDAWLKQPENISKLARLSGVPEGDVPGLVKGNTYLTPQQQTAELTGPVNKAIIDTAQFLKEQGKVPAVANDYSQYVTSRFVQ